MPKNHQMLPKTAAEELRTYRSNMETVCTNLQFIPTDRAQAVAQEANAAITSIDTALSGDPSLEQVEQIYQKTVDVVTKATAIVSSPVEDVK